MPTSLSSSNNPPSPTTRIRESAATLSATQEAVAARLVSYGLQVEESQILTSGAATADRCSVELLVTNRNSKPRSRTADSAFSTPGSRVRPRYTTPSRSKATKRISAGISAGISADLILEDPANRG